MKIYLEYFIDIKIKVIKFGKFIVDNKINRIKFGLIFVNDLMIYINLDLV